MKQSIAFKNVSNTEYKRIQVAKMKHTQPMFSIHRLPRNSQVSQNQSKNDHRTANQSSLLNLIKKNEANELPIPKLKARPSKE
jgi:hypothetical protein